MTDTKKDENTYEAVKRTHENDPLYGKTLESILVFLVDHYGFEELGTYIKINSFTTNPSIKSSLTFLRKTPWARTQVEELYLTTIKDLERRGPVSKS